MRHRVIFANLATVVLIAVSSGCYHQQLTVPSHDQMVSEFHYELTVETLLKAKLVTVGENDPMTIDEHMWDGESPQPRAFRRLASGETVSGAAAGKIELEPGTTIKVTKIEVYPAAHVYVGTLTSGPAAAHVLYVAPTFSDAVKDHDQLLASDRLYVRPVGPAPKPNIPIY